MVDRGTDRTRGTLLGLALGAAGSEDGEIDLCLGFATALSTQAVHGPTPVIRELSRALASWGAGPGASRTCRLTSREAARRLRESGSLSMAALPWSKESGSEVRGALAGLLFLDHPTLLGEVAALLASSTHGHPTTVLTSALVGNWTVRALGGSPPVAWPTSAPAGSDPVGIAEWAGAVGPLEQAVEAATDRRAMESLGEGWVSEEATAMALAALLRHPDRFEDALACAVDHDGDRSAVGRLAGALAGARLGASALPSTRVVRLADAPRLIRLADALVAARTDLARRS